MKKINKKSFGGQLLATAANFIPGVGPLISPVVGMVDQQLEKDKLAKEAKDQASLNAPPIKINTNPYGQFAKGGTLLNDMFKQYDTGSHQSGNDLTVAEDGTPDPNGSNSVQGTENSFQVNGKQYVMSNVLKNPKTGNTFNIDAAEINKKYPHARTSLDQRAALDFEMEQLAKVNDAVRSTETNEKAYGGPLLNKAISNAANYWKDNQYPTVTGDQVPSAQGNMFTQPVNTESVPAATTNSFVNPLGPVQASPKSKFDLQIPIADGFNFKNTASNLTPNTAEVSAERDVTVPKAETSDVLGSKTANAIGLGMKGLALASSISDAMQPAEKEDLITPDYRKADNYMQSANIDYSQAKQDTIGVSNIAANMNRSLTGNAAAFQGREQARLSQLQDALGRISEGENNAQSQLNLTKGQYEEGKAVDTANRKYQNQQGNMQNEAAARLMDRNLASDLSQIGSSFNEYAETQKVIKNNAEINKFNTTQALSMIQAKFPGWKVDPNIMQQFKDGKIDMDEMLKYTPGTPAEKIALKKELEVKTKG